MAGRERSFTQETKKKIEDILDNLPEKPKAERPLTTKELLNELKSKIRTAQSKGYTLDEIVNKFNQSGVQISVSTVKAALRSSTLKRVKKVEAESVE